MGFIDHGNIVNMIRVSFKLSDSINILFFVTGRGKNAFFFREIYILFGTLMGF